MPNISNIPSLTLVRFQSLVEIWIIVVVIVVTARYEGLQDKQRIEKKMLVCQSPDQLAKRLNELVSVRMQCLMTE